MRVQLQLRTAGACTHAEHMVLRGASRQTVAFPSLYAQIQHPHEGLILYDTGYSPRFFSATDPFPERFYRLLTPVTLSSEQTAAAQLRQQGLAPEDVKWVIISHFHGDHVAGLRDFPHARFAFLEHGYAHVSQLSRLQAVRTGYLQSLLPPDFMQRAEGLTLAGPRLRYVAPFGACLDLFGDGSLQMVPLEGHFCGQSGLLINSEDGPVLLVADACWRRESFEDLRLPHPLAMAIMHDPERYRHDLQQIQSFAQAHPHVPIVPSHCTRSLQAWRNRLETARGSRL
ncbi:MAG: MBL fold metallo-hydrolase [Candidatus Sericytochromatia bacterium]